MYYELYIDVFWMTNFMMDSLLLFAVRQMLKCPVGKGRIFMGGIVGSTMTCLIVLLPLSGLLRFFAGGILTALVMIRVGFGKQPVRMYRKAFVFLYISAFLMSGILQLFRPIRKCGISVTAILNDLGLIAQFIDFGNQRIGL